MGAISAIALVEIEISRMFKPDPFENLEYWLNDKKVAGASNPKQGVLSTCGLDLKPHSTVVAVKEITQEGLIFFTQKGTRKVSEIVQNSRVSFVFWFELLQREVVLEGVIPSLTDEENNHHWQEYPKEA